MNHLIRSAATFVVASILTIGGSLAADAADSEAPLNQGEPGAVSGVSKASAARAKVQQVANNRRIVDSIDHESATYDSGLARAQPGKMPLKTPSDTSLVRTKRLAVGVEDGHVYYQLNGWDQDVVMSGMTLGLGLALCAIPAVGTLGCAGINVVLQGTALYLSHHGKCPENRELRVTLPIGRSFRCA